MGTQFHGRRSSRRLTGWPLSCGRGRLEVGIGLAVVELGGSDQRTDDGPAIGGHRRSQRTDGSCAQGDRPDGPVRRYWCRARPGHRRGSGRGCPNEPGRNGWHRREGCAVLPRCSSASSQSFREMTRGRANSLRTARRSSADRPRSFLRQRKARRSGARPRPQSASRSPDGSRRTSASYEPSRPPARYPWGPAARTQDRPSTLQDSLEPLQMRNRTLGPAIAAVEVDGYRRIGPTPRSIIPRIDP